jgi:hypothetical protein
MNIWTVSTRGHEEFVAAESARDAMEVARIWPHDEFGLIVCAQPLGAPESEMIPIRTSALMAAWGDIDMARRYIETAIMHGLGDTTAEDINGAITD